MDFTNIQKLLLRTSNKIYPILKLITIFYPVGEFFVDYFIFLYLNLFIIAFY